jgi:hypothetical protein
MEFRRCTHDFPNSLKSHDDNGNIIFCRCTHEFPECISNPYLKRMMVGGKLFSMIIMEIENNFAGVHMIFRIL